jgi:lipopolysaccharide biosynthesis regulator YciM
VKIEKMRELIDIEMDCIRSGISMTPVEQAAAISALVNLKNRLPEPATWYRCRECGYESQDKYIECPKCHSVKIVEEKGE